MKKLLYECSRVIHTARPQFVVNHQPAVIDNMNQGNLQSNILVGSSVQGQNVSSNSALIRQDFWKQLKSVRVPIFTGDTKTYVSKLKRCIYGQAPATAEYKFLQLKVCLLVRY